MATTTTQVKSSQVPQDPQDGGGAGGASAPPPPYDEACAMPAMPAMAPLGAHLAPPMNTAVAMTMTAELHRSALNHPDLYERAAQRGVLASRGTVPWGWRGRGGCCWGRRHDGAVATSATTTGQQSVVVVQQPPLIGPPGPPESVIEARQFRCGVCKNLSFVRQEDVGTYIKCPFCRQTSTTNPLKSRIPAILFVSLGITLALSFIVFWIVLPFLDNGRGYRGHHILIFPVSLTALCLKRGWDYRSLPRSTLLEGYVPYLPSLYEVVHTTGPRRPVVFV